MYRHIHNTLYRNLADQSEIGYIHEAVAERERAERERESRERESRAERAVAERVSRES